MVRSQKFHTSEISLDTGVYCAEAGMHAFRSKVAGVTFSESDSAPVPNFGIRVRLFFKFENLTPVQTPATIINPTIIYPCFYLRNDHKDSCYCRNWKVTPVLEPVFPKYLTPDPGPKEKRRILPESTPVFRIRSHLCFRYDMHWLSTLTSCISWRSSDVTTRYDVPHSLNC